MPLAVLFPGQGSQKVGMLSQFVSSYEFIPGLFHQASELLDIDLWSIVSQGPEETLNATIYTQPAMLVADIAMWQIFQQECPDLKPRYLAGHSLGELSALVAAQAISFQDAIKLVSVRAHLMQEAVEAGKGSMAAVLGMDDEQVQKLCALVEPASSVAPANFNCPGQIVVAGYVEAVDQLIQLVKENAGKAIKLPVSVPSHSPLMKSAAEEFAKKMQDIPMRLPKIPVIHNVDVSISQSVVELKEKLVQQLFSPVQWTNTIRFLIERGINQCYECGPGSVLSNLIKRISKEIEVITPF